LGASAIPSGAATLVFGGPVTTAGLGGNSLETITLNAGESTPAGGVDYFFTLAMAGTFAANATEGTSAGGNSLNPFSMELVNVTGGNLVLASDNSPVANGSQETVTLNSVGPLMAGITYELIVVATDALAPTNPPTPVSIDGNVTITPSPLPGTLPLFASSIVGFWAWKRKRRNALSLDAAAA
jgi:hypothetical protein